MISALVTLLLALPTLLGAHDVCDGDSAAVSDQHVEAWIVHRVPSGPPDSTALRGATWFWPGTSEWVAGAHPVYVGRSQDLPPGSVIDMVLPAEDGAVYLFRAVNPAGAGKCWAACQAWR